MKSVRKMLLVAGAVAALTAAPALATDTVTQAITQGTLSASVADLALPSLTYAHTAQNSSGMMTLTADDSTGTAQGWNVTIQSTAFVYAGAYAGANIPAANFSLTSVGTPSTDAGQAVDGVNGPRSVTTTGTLDSARKVIQSTVGYGVGRYSQSLGVTLAVPAQARVGTYTGTLITTITAGP